MDIVSIVVFVEENQSIFLQGDRKSGRQGATFTTGFVHPPEESGV